MKLYLRVVVALLGITGQLALAHPYLYTWYVVERLSDQACFRIKEPPVGQGWRVLGAVDTFRQAGMLEWQYRSICKRGPLFD
jgi:hypothetical protein